VYIQLYTVGHCSQSSDGQRNLSSDANRGVSTFRRSLDSVDSSGDKTTITTIPTVGVYSSSDKKTIATFPAFQDDLLKC